MRVQQIPVFCWENWSRGLSSAASRAQRGSGYFKSPWLVIQSVQVSLPESGKATSWGLWPDSRTFITPAKFFSMRGYWSFALGWIIFRIKEKNLAENRSKHLPCKPIPIPFSSKKPRERLNQKLTPVQNTAYSQPCRFWRCLSLSYVLKYRNSRRVSILFLPF